MSFFVRRLASAGLIGSPLAILYVLFTDGANGTYQVGGADGGVWSGLQVIAAAAVAFIASVIALGWVNRRDARRARRHGPT